MQDAQRAGTAATTSPAEAQGCGGDSQPAGGHAAGDRRQAVSVSGTVAVQYQSQPSAEITPDEAAPVTESTSDPAAEAGGVGAMPAPDAESASEAAASSGLSAAATPEPGTGGVGSGYRVGPSPSRHRPQSRFLSRQQGPHVARLPVWRWRRPRCRQRPRLCCRLSPYGITGGKLVLPGNAATGLAAFRSGGDLVLVVDHPLAGPTEPPAGGTCHSMGRRIHWLPCRSWPLQALRLFGCRCLWGMGRMARVDAPQGQALPPHRARA
jgi:hypothetical protein